MNKRHYEHTLPNIRGSLSNTYCAAALASLSVPHHHLAPLVQNPPELDFPLRGRAVSIRQFSTHVSLKILQDYG